MIFRRRHNWKQEAQVYRELFETVADWGDDCTCANLELMRQNALLVEAVCGLLNDYDQGDTRAIAAAKKVLREAASPMTRSRFA